MRAVDDTPDETVQWDVLAFLLEQPVQTALAELLREMAEATYGPHTADAVERATRDLVHVGLLHRHGDFLFPTRAAVHSQGLPR